MHNSKSVVFLLSSLVLGVVLLTAADVVAQPAELTIDPSGTAPQPAPEPEPSTASVPGQIGIELPPDEAPENVYYGDYLSEEDLQDEDREDGQSYHGVIPLTHEVRSGDTLWDIAAYYFNNPWSWPKVWGLNPEITNPHWIYPGNLIRLREASTELPATGTDAQAPGVAIKSGRVLGLRQTAYIDIEELQHAGVVDGAIEEKALLSVGDSVYVDYGDQGVPVVGDTLAVYTESTKIKRDGEAVGAYVEVAGEVQFTFAKEGKRARAVVIRAAKAITRGMRVGPLKLNFRNTKPVVNETRMSGEIVDLIGPDELIGANVAVIIDRGVEDGVKVGNRFLVVRRGDAYQEVMKPGGKVGQDDPRYPARAIGEIIVIQAGKKSCLGTVTFSLYEFGVGDRVFMRKGQ